VVQDVRRDDAIEGAILHGTSPTVGAERGRRAHRPVVQDLDTVRAIDGATPSPR
jgi:hypothetical protein